MGLMILLALAFVAPTAMAAEFGVSLDMTDDVSTADGLQLEYQYLGSTLRFRVEFAEAVRLSGGDIEVSGFDADGVYIPGVKRALIIPVAPTPAAPTAAVAVARPTPAVTPPTTARTTARIYLTPAATVFEIWVIMTTETRKVTFKIAEGIASADPFNDDTSAELQADIQLLAADEGEPRVLSIERVDNPLLPVTSETVQVIVTLSEPAAAFTKDHISITDNATVADPVALDPVAEDPGRFRDLAAIIEESQLAPTPKWYVGFIIRMSTVMVIPTDPEDIQGIHADIVATGYLFFSAVAYLKLTTDDSFDTIEIQPIIDFLTERLAVTEQLNHTIPVHRPVRTYTLPATGTDIVYPGDSNNAITWAAGSDAATIEKAIADAEKGAPIRQTLHLQTYKACSVGLCNPRRVRGRTGVL